MKPYMVGLVVFPLAIGVTPLVAESQDDRVSKLKSVSLEVRVDSPVHIDQQRLRDHALVMLRSKIPRLKVENRAVNGVPVIDESQVVIAYQVMETASVSGMKTGWAGRCDVTLSRIVTFQPTGKTLLAGTWTEGTLFIGGGQGAALQDQAANCVDDLIDDFAADYYKAGNE